MALEGTFYLACGSRDRVRASLAEGPCYTARQFLSAPPASEHVVFRHRAGHTHGKEGHGPDAPL